MQKLVHCSIVYYFTVWCTVYIPLASPPYTYLSFIVQLLPHILAWYKFVLLLRVPFDMSKLIVYATFVRLALVIETTTVAEHKRKASEMRTMEEVNKRASSEEH